MAWQVVVVIMALVIYLSNAAMALARYRRVVQAAGLAPGDRRLWSYTVLWSSPLLLLAAGYAVTHWG